MTSETSETVHLLVLIHGMWGNPNHLAEMHRIFDETLCQPSDSKAGPDGERVHVLLAETNRESSTYDGIDWGGERVAEEITAEVKKLAEEGKTVTRFSLTGYSLGGLIGRYVVGILHQSGFFKTISPVNFNTVATPHIGLIRYPTFRSALFAALGPKLLSRTGEQFYAVDKWSTRGRPLLEVMADPDRVFYQALSSFHNICFYANAVNDLTVPYMTSAIESEDPFEDHALNGMKIEFDEKYSPIVKGYSLSETPIDLPPKPTMFSPTWFKSIKLPLPPALDFRFPFNILLLASLPVVFPAFLSLVLVRLTLDSHSSRGRIKLLEADKSYPDRLIHVVGQLEKSMEDAVAEMIDDPGNVPDTPHSDRPIQSEEIDAFSKILDDGEGVSKRLVESDESGNESAGPGTSGVNTPSGAQTPPKSSASSFVEGLGKSKCSSRSSSRLFRRREDKAQNGDDASSCGWGSKKKAKGNGKGKKEDKEKPLLSDLQKSIVKSLNEIPNLKKQLAFIDPVLNSHAVIVSRDVKRFKHHTIGEGVLRHLADHFVV